ncbi:MAG: DUF4278 domain-containing protein [Leptolyngbya sp. SIO3F4]|nr:DUF4278 domain-containing protein [Leptolyngbya sp. SIO3F4]
MQLTYRGNTYNMTAPIQSDSVVNAQSNIKLTYRGQQYNYTPPIALSDASASQVVTLTYRGNTYTLKLQPIQCIQESHAINGHYQVSVAV